MPRLLMQLAACLLVVGLCQTAYEQPAQVAASSARLIECYGDVQTRHGAGSYQAAHVGETLVPGEGIKTGAGSRAQLAIGTSQYVRMDQSTQVLITTVQQDGYTTLKTIVGGVWVTIQKAIGVPTKFDVQTPSVVAGARGTIFRCDVLQDGDTSVYVYEGEVDVTGAGEVVRVIPDRFARARQGAKPSLSDTDTDQDERHDFVRYNRHCEALGRLGNPKVLVALSVVEDTKPQAALPASARLVQRLQQLGFLAIPVKSEHLRDATYDAQGTVRLKSKLAEYLLVGAIRVQAPRPTPGRPGKGLVVINAKLVGGDDYHVISTAQAQRPFTVPPAAKPFGLPNGTGKQAILTALNELADEVADRLGPQLLRGVAADRPDAVRVEITGVTDPRQMRALKDLLGSLQPDGRVTPLPRFDGENAFLLATATPPADIARTCRERGGQWLQSVEVRGKVVQIVVRPGALPPQPGG